MFIIGGVDEVIQQLEENQIELSAMLGHRYVGGIKKVYLSLSMYIHTSVYSLLSLF